jgi:hypothetical protein
VTCFKVGDKVRGRIQRQVYTVRCVAPNGPCLQLVESDDTWYPVNIFELYVGHEEPGSQGTGHTYDPPAPVAKDYHAVRKGQPVVRGVLDYFPEAIKAVAECSRVGNEQHSPGEPMHHARGKSPDHADALVRHLMDRGTVDSDGVRHSAKVAWRALALLQEELEAAGAPRARGAK